MVIQPFSMNRIMVLYSDKAIVRLLLFSDVLRVICFFFKDTDMVFDRPRAPKLLWNPLETPCSLTLVAMAPRRIFVC